MTPQEPDPSPSDMRKLLDELRDLVGDLGLADPTATSQPPLSRTADADEEDEDDGYGDEADLNGEAEAPAAAAGAVATVETAGLWEAFAPELEADPPRAWSPAAAMAVIEPAAPPRPPRRRRRLLPRLRTRLFTVIAGVAALLAIALLVISRLDLGRTGGPAQPVPSAAFAVTSMRTVQATSPTGVAHAPTLDRFPRNVPAIYIDIVYRNVTPQDSLRLIISLLPASGNNGLLTPVSDVIHSNLDPGGEIAVSVEAPSGGFVPGTYTVTALHGDHLEQSITFKVDAVAGTASPPPSGASPSPSPLPSAVATF